MEVVCASLLLQSGVGTAYSVTSVDIHCKQVFILVTIKMYLITGAAEVLHTFKGMWNTILLI